MTPAELKHYLLHNATTNGLANTVANGGICWFLIKDKGIVTWWGHSNFGGDLLATGFILPFIVTLIVIPIQRMKVRKGKIAGVSTASVSGWLERFTRMPSNLWAQAGLFGLLGMLVIAAPTLALLWLSGITEFTPMAYAIFKGVWAGVLAAFVVLPMIVVALSSAVAVEANNNADLAQP